MKYNIKHDLPVVGAIYILIIILGMYLHNLYILDHQKTETLEVKKVAVEINQELEQKRTEVQELKETTSSLKTELKTHEDVKRLVKDLDRFWGVERR